MMHFGPCRATAEAVIQVQIIGLRPPYSDGGTTFSNFESRVPNPSTGVVESRGFQRRKSKSITGIDFDRCDRSGYYFLQNIASSDVAHDSSTINPATVQIHLADRNGNIVTENLMQGVTGQPGESWGQDRAGDFFGGPTVQVGLGGTVGIAISGGQVVVESTPNLTLALYQFTIGSLLQAVVFIDRDDFSFIRDVTIADWAQYDETGFTAERLSMCD